MPNIYIEGKAHEIPEGLSGQDYLAQLVQRDVDRLLAWGERYIQSDDLPEIESLVVGISLSVSTSATTNTTSIGGAE